MKAYLELEGKLSTNPNCNCMPVPICLTKLFTTKTPVLKKAEKKKRAKAPVKEEVHGESDCTVFACEPNLACKSYSNGSYNYGNIMQMSAVKLKSTTASPTLIPVTVYNLAQSRIQEIPNPPMRFQGEEDPSIPNSDNPLRCSNPKLQPVPQPCRPEKTPHGQIPCQPLLTYFLQGHHGQFPKWNTHVHKTEKAEDRTPPKIAAMPHTMVSKPPQNKAEGTCRWGLHCHICGKSTPNLQGREFRRLEWQKTGPVAKKLLSSKPSVFSIIWHSGQVLWVQ